MKTLKFLIALLTLSMGMSCSENDTPGQRPDDLQEQDLLKSKLTGEWVVSGHKDSYIYTFADNDTVYIKNREGDTIDKWPYQTIAEDSIRIIRNWTTHSKVVFYSNDSIRINDFILDIITLEFSDVVLKRWLNNRKPELTGIKWKLTGFVIGGNVKTPEQDSDNSYWLLFKNDNTLEGKSSTNELMGSYEINAQTSSLLITNLGGTKINELPDGRLFVESLRAVRSFELREGTLKLYFSETDYLFFNIQEIPPAIICNCVMDTLQGQWIWIKTYDGSHGTLSDNEFKSVLKITGQNEDRTINYESHVADTLFYKGTFKFEQTQWTNIVIQLPHWTADKDNRWNLLFHNEQYKATKDTVCFYSGNPDDYMFYYKKIE
jgi:hypothetical protein